MRKIQYRLVYNRKKRLNGMGTALIQIEAYLERKKIYFSTGIYVLPSQWDEQRSLVVNHPHEEALNRFIQERILELEWKEFQSWKEGKNVGLELLSEKPVKKTLKQALIQDMGRKWIEASSRKESTRRNLNTTIDIVEEYRPNATFHDITYEWITEFELFLRNRQLSANTIAKHLRHLRILVNEAIRHGLLPSSTYPFRDYRIKTTETHYAFLSPKEINQLESLTLTGKDIRMQHVLDAFLFCCYTGLRYSDFVHQQKENIIQSGEYIWLVFNSVKTSLESRIPLDLIFEGKPMNILRKYHDKENDFFRLTSNSLANKYLIKIGELANIHKHFSFHSARHTNATLLLYMGAQITTVQKLLGHRNIKTTQGYSDILEETIVKDLKKCKL